ncbi:hypothetical protein OSB04_002248 [Centaurea solstitialis]|uniref:Peptidase C1A papain C-terminal domain-containing protein n=1 Tax=Centaurea solstitialis TaxID=347529 RepID=A0AA38WM68_9ASTR|nr:hypothetical protein OSB04_002248 [Centaurea solstitialis]
MSHDESLPLVVLLVFGMWVCHVTSRALTEETIGSWWAFSRIAATKGITQLTTKKLISLSEQELMDCDRSREDQGCEGGYMDDGFKFIVDNKGINTEAAYAYQAADATCNTKKEAVHTAKITGH